MKIQQAVNRQLAVFSFDLLAEFCLEILDRDPGRALCGIRQDVLHLVFGPDHLAALGMLTVELDCVKLALCRADTAAYTLIFIYY